MKINNADCGVVQDLFHYSLALMGEENAVDANCLRRRLECGESALRILSLLEVEAEANFFESVIPRPDMWNREADMVAAGKMLNDKVVEWAQFNGIDPRTGTATTISCSICGKPAMTKQTQCYKHFFGHEIGQ